jgi:NCAIR mutase (PurE)-related protein
MARAITLQQTDAPAGKGIVGVVCAGTSDLPVAEEAAVTARLMGNTVELVADVGVAGIHRLLAQQHTLQSSRVLVVCAGMEGALPTVVGGLVSAPVIAVPTSVGYGASLGGIAALLGMLNTCAPNVSVVNIDNGFGAACIASLINHL